MRQGEVRDGHWWDWGSWWRWYLLRPLGWWLAGLRPLVARLRFELAFHLAGWRDQYATWKIRRNSDVVR